VLVDGVVLVLVLVVVLTIAWRMPNKSGSFFSYWGGEMAGLAVNVTAGKAGRVSVMG
jgi:hypothetical protein